MNLLFIGDVFGKPGRNAVRNLLPGLRRELSCDFVIANGENAASGAGITASTAEELFSAGVDVLTGGNHTFDRREGLAVLDDDPRILRPFNYPPDAPGRGSGLYDCGPYRIGVLNLIGRVFLPATDCPFRAADSVLEDLAGATPIVVVDLHAEASSEKQGMAWYLDGRATLVVGTHTHVQTADERILPRGTAAIGDVGMTGPHDSIIGVRKELALHRLRTQMPVRFQPAEEDVRLHAVVVRIDPESGRALEIRRIQRNLE
ncbi:MAG: TIGR00282 family metallophosphoesterase [Candidatus Eisenbacteria bacterium]|nr:TIGR00282 family metallophosphoesterase [Candidatus Latescibacterota bacterium]MBD3302979.1 TIGR00282 family metallophosphoesterase [Candidatus Eisenbacteria bacterium]